MSLHCQNGYGNGNDSLSDEVFFSVDLKRTKCDLNTVTCEALHSSATKRIVFLHVIENAMIDFANKMRSISNGMVNFFVKSQKKKNEIE